MLCKIRYDSIKKKHDKMKKLLKFIIKCQMSLECKINVTNSSKYILISDGSTWIENN